MHWNPLSNKCHRNSARNKGGLKKIISPGPIPSRLFGNLMLVFKIHLFKLYLIWTKRSFSPVFALLCANPGHARVATDVCVFVTGLRFRVQAPQSLSLSKGLDATLGYVWTEHQNAQIFNRSKIRPLSCERNLSELLIVSLPVLYQVSKSFCCCCCFHFAANDQYSSWNTTAAWPR